MPSRAERRGAAEWVLRALLVIALAVGLWRSLHASAASPMTRTADVRGLPDALREATRAASVVAIDLHVDSLPGAMERDWLAALRRAGVAVRWHGAPPALALEPLRSREPESRVRLLVTSDSAVPLAIADSAGSIDMMRVTTRGGELESSAIVGEVHAQRGRWLAGGRVPPASPPRAVLVLGRAGWEGKFVAAALQESGWTVRARMPAAPNVFVADAGVLPIDTARYAAVVALDSTANDLAPTLARFVAQGGGLVLAGDTPSLVSLRALAPARTAARLPGRILLESDSVTRPDLPVRPLDAIRGDAVRLEGEPAGVTVAVRRAGAGRVITVGYDESWRWRMLGGENGPSAHRDWWSRTVGLVAPERAEEGLSDVQSVRPSDSPTVRLSQAPTAALFAALGPPAPAATDATSPARDSLPLALLALVVAALLAETASRRFRGAR
jgi:hypothetical protein